jgi:hypothetical protein
MKWTLLLKSCGSSVSKSLNEIGDPSRSLKRLRVKCTVGRRRRVRVRVTVRVLHARQSMLAKTLRGLKLLVYEALSY